MTGLPRFFGGDYMYLIKSLNNNIVLAGENGKEMVLFGKGIGFERQRNAPIDPKKIQKKFILEEADDITRSINILPQEIITVAEKIMSLAQTKLKANQSLASLFALGDHIYYALRRLEKKEKVYSPLSWEIPHLYPKEYEVATRGIEIINLELQCQMPIEEAAFITIHLINGQKGAQTLSSTMKLIETTSRIITIVNYSFQVKIDETSFEYSRFVNHIRFFIIRQEEHKPQQEVVDVLLLQSVIEKYPKSHECALKIKKYLELQYECPINDTELLYLVLYIERLIQETSQQLIES